MIRVACQICKEEMSVPDSLVGQFEACPSCKALVPVPDPYKPDVPAGWYSDRVASAHAEKLRQAVISARKLIRGLVRASLVIGTFGLVELFVVPWTAGFVLPESAEASVAIAVAILCFAWVIAALLAIAALAVIPGAVARSRGLTNADGLSVLGILGVFIPIVWLVALVMALVCTPPASRGHP